MPRVSHSVYLTMDRLAALLYSLIAQLLVCAIVSSNDTYPACIEGTFDGIQDARSGDPGLENDQCSNATVVDNCVGQMTEVFQAEGRLNYRELNRIAQDCVNQLRDEDEDAQVECISDLCNRLNESVSADLANRLVCTQEFVYVVAGNMNRTGAGRIVNQFMQRCMENLPNDATDNFNRAVNDCVETYVRYCFVREWNQLEECIDDVEFLCDTIDDPDSDRQRQCIEATERSVSGALTERCSRTDNLDICEQLYYDILDDHSTPSDIALLAAVTKGLVRFENSTDLFLDLTEQLFTNLTANNTFTLVDVKDAAVFFESFDALLTMERVLGADKYTKKISKGSNMLRNLEMLSNLVGQNLLSNKGRLNSNFSYGGDNMKFSVHFSNRSTDEPYRSPGIQSDDGGNARIELPTCYLCGRSNPSTSPGVSGSMSSQRCVQPSIDEGCQSVVVTLAMNNIAMLLEDSVNRTRNLTVVGAVISSQVIWRDQDERDRDEGCDVGLDFTIPELHQNNENYSNPVCCFWDFDIGEYGGWSSEGVNTTVVSNTSVVCTSTHLTSFAILFDTQGVTNNLPKIERQALSYVGYIGSGISLISLIITIGFLIVFHKKLNRGSLLYIHLNFCIALALALLLLLVGLQTATSVRWLCGVVAGLLHYLFLAVFCWMLCEGIMLYLLVVRVFGSAADKWYLLTPLGWGLPVIVVAITAGIRHEQYGHYSETLNYCWLSTEHGVVWSFVGPVIAIICVNSLILVLTVAALVKGRKKGGAETNVKKRALVVSAVKGVVVLLPLLGITWIIGVFAVNSNTSVFLWIFTIFNSLQGLAIFLLHVVRSQIVMSFVHKSVIKPLSSHHHRSRNSRSSITKDIMTKDEEITDDKLHDKIEMADLQQDNIDQTDHN